MPLSVHRFFGQTDRLAVLEMKDLQLHDAVVRGGQYYFICRGGLVVYSPLFITMFWNVPCAYGEDGGWWQPVVPGTGHEWPYIIYSEMIHHVCYFVLMPVLHQVVWKLQLVCLVVNYMFSHRTGLLNRWSFNGYRTSLDHYLNSFEYDFVQWKRAHRTKMEPHYFTNSFGVQSFSQRHVPPRYQSYSLYCIYVHVKLIYRQEKSILF